MGLNCNEIKGRRIFKGWGELKQPPSTFFDTKDQFFHCQRRGGRRQSSGELHLLSAAHLLLWTALEGRRGKKRGTEARRWGALWGQRQLLEVELGQASLLARLLTGPQPVPVHVLRVRDPLANGH